MNFWMYKKKKNWFGKGLVLGSVEKLAYLRLWVD